MPNLLEGSRVFPVVKFLRERGARPLRGQLVGRGVSPVSHGFVEIVTAPQEKRLRNFRFLVVVHQYHDTLALDLGDVEGTYLARISNSQLPNRQAVRAIAKSQYQ